jgi:hypothetical protein
VKLHNLPSSGYFVAPYKRYSFAVPCVAVEDHKLFDDLLGAVLGSLAGVAVKNFCLSLRHDPVRGEELIRRGVMPADIALWQVNF